MWASSDEGKSWIPINVAGPFPQRHLFVGTTTKDGLIILAGGFADEVAGGAPSTLASIQNDGQKTLNTGHLDTLPVTPPSLTLFSVRCACQCG